MDGGYDHVSWELVDEVDGTVALSRSDGYYTWAEYYLESACIADGCYTLSLYDIASDGICCIPSHPWGLGWYRVWVNGESVTFDGKLRYWEDSSESILFCTSLFADNDTLAHNLTIIIDYDTQISITNVSDNVDDDSDTLVYADNDAYEYYIDVENYYYSSNVFTLQITEGCYLINMYDDIKNDYGSLLDAKHGSYTIYMNSIVVAYGGYYNQIETNLVCTNSQHISTCITPEFCKNNHELYIPNYQLEGGTKVVSSNIFTLAYFTATSYKFWDNSTYWDYFGDDYIPGVITCYGTYSCSNLSSVVTSLRCDAAFACSDPDEEFSVTIATNTDAGEGLFCGGIKTCENVRFSVWYMHEISFSTLLTGNAISSVTGKTYFDMNDNVTPFAGMCNNINFVNLPCEV